MGLGKGISLSRFKEGVQDANQEIKHPPKGTIGFHSKQESGFQGY